MTTLTDQWIYFVKNARTLNSIPESMKTVPAIERAFQVANRANLDRVELDELEHQEFFIQDQRNSIVKGFNQGLQQGLQQASLEIAKQLIGLLDEETISQKTGLSLEIVRQLIDEENWL